MDVPCCSTLRLTLSHGLLPIPPHGECVRMAQKAFYNVLQLDQNATLDEIKLAFKRRALQVHPDKGGSKDEFQLVYQAFETLADPKARQKYDVNLAANKSAPQNIPRHQKKTSRRSNPSASKDVPPMPRQHQRCESSKRTSDDGAASHPPAPQTSQSKQDQAVDEDPSFAEAVASRQAKWCHCQPILTETAYYPWEMDDR